MHAAHGRHRVIQHSCCNTNKTIIRIIIVIILDPGTQPVPRVNQKIKYKEMKLEWLLILPLLNRETVVQQDSVKALIIITISTGLL